MFHQWGLSPVVVFSFFLLVLFGCEQNTAEVNWLEKDFAEIEQAAQGTEVSWYMYGGWSHVNKWVDTYVAQELKKRYDITLKRVPMEAGVFVNKLLNEKAAGKQSGSIDLLWINGENFKNSKEAGAVYGPFAFKLPNFNRYVDPQSVEHDFGYAVQGYEAPFGRAYFVFEYDQARTEEPPRNFQALKNWIKAHPGKFTYPQPPDFTGSAFIRQLFYALTDGHEQYMQGFDSELFRAKASELWKYLNAIEPYLWQKDKTYPKDSATLDTLFARGEVDLNMSYHPPHAQNKILEGTYPESVRTYSMQEGALYNTHFTAIPFNAPNKPGAMVLANFLLSPQAQLSKYRPDNWGDFPAVDLHRLDKKQRELFKTVDLGPATLSPAKLSTMAVPEIPAAYLEELEKGWEENVLRN